MPSRSVSDRPVEEARVAEEPEHGPATRLRGEVGGKPCHRGVGVVAGRRHYLASRCIACKYDVQVIAEQCLGEEHSGRMVGVGSPEPLAKTVTEAARFVAERGVLKEGAPILLKFVTQVAARFGLVVTQKVAAQALS